MTVIATKTRYASDLTSDLTTLHTTLNKPGEDPVCYIMDNEFSTEVKKAMTKYQLTYQLVPPHQHRRNAAERAIQTFKHHFISGLSSTNFNFPINQWDRLIPQAIITLNLLRKARANPNLSSYAYLHGNYNFNKNPMAPPGTLMLAHEKPAQRGSWDTHGL